MVTIAVMLVAGLAVAPRLSLVFGLRYPHTKGEAEYWIDKNLVRGSSEAEIASWLEKMQLQHQQVAHEHLVEADASARRVGSGLRIDESGWQLTELSNAIHFKVEPRVWIPLTSRELSFWLLFDKNHRFVAKLVYEYDYSL
jgi:hypothetical protein